MNPAELDGFKLGRGNVHQNIARAQTGKVLANAGIVFTQGVKAGFRRNVEFGAGPVINLAGGGNAMGALECLQGDYDFVVKYLRRFDEELFKGQVAFGDQALAQDAYRFTLHAFLKFALADTGPAAPGNDFLIGLNCALKGAD